MDKKACVVCGDLFVDDGKSICPECRVEVTAGERRIIQALRRIAAAIEGLKPEEKPEPVRPAPRPVQKKPEPKE